MTEDKVKNDRDKVLDEKRHVSTKISDNCRFIGFGLVALYYTVMTAQPGFGADLRTAHPWVIQGIGFSGVVTILLDYLQFVFGYFSVEQALKTTDSRYPKSLSRKARTILFFAKQSAAFVGALLVVIVVAIAAFKVI